jgi:ABC-type transport system involved in multi-copper enzyme maturation permease subunit
MTTRAIKRKRDEEPLGQPEWQAPEERAPSVVRAEQATPARFFALVALFITAVGGLAVLMGFINRQYLINPGMGTFLLVAGLAGLMLHAFSEKELVYRRVYGVLAGALVLAGTILSVVTYQGHIGGLFLPIGAPGLFLALCFGVSFARNETDPLLRLVVLRLIGIAGAIMIVVGLVGGVLSESFLMSHGVVYLLLALLYVGTFVSMQSTSSAVAYWAGYALGVVGVVMIVISLGRVLPFSGVPWVGPYLAWINTAFGSLVKWPGGQPGAPFLFIYLGLEYLFLSIGICSDAQWVVLTRRELMSYFYSPVAYIVLIAVSVLSAGSFFLFTIEILAYSSSPMVPGFPEPILRDYFSIILGPIGAVILVPVVTMRLFSEEKRSGTLEVLLTAPVREGTVVLSKYLAALRFYLLAWYPLGLYLIALRVEGTEAFDYRPVLTFAIALAVTGAGFVAIGLFFSSLSGNQIIAAVLTAVAMVVLLLFIVVNRQLEQVSPFWSGVFRHMSFYDLWIEAAAGQFTPRYLIFHISAAIFFLFLTVKVLESRKWR